MGIGSSGGVLRVYGRGGGTEVRSCGNALQACGRRDVEWRYGDLDALEVRCRRCLFVSGALAYCLLLLEFLAFVPQGSLLVDTCASKRKDILATHGFRGTPANLSVLAARKGPLRLAGVLTCDY